MTNGQAVQPSMAVPGSQQRIHENALKGLAMQLAQVQLDQAYLTARFTALLEVAQAVVSSTDWSIIEEDGDPRMPVAVEPLQMLQMLLVGG